MKLVGLALTKWAPHVPDRAFRVLMRMAMTALDEATPERPAEMFYGGRDLLVSVLRAERYGNLKALEKALERAVKDLIEIGAIERTNAPRAGHRAEYRLTLFNVPRIDEVPVDNQGQGDTHVGAQGDTHVPPGRHPRGGSGRHPRALQGDTHVGAKEKGGELQEELEEQPQEQSPDLGEPVAVRARDAEPPRQEIPPRCRNPECLNGYVIDKSKPKGKRTTRCPECNPPDNVIQFGRRRA